MTSIDVNFVVAIHDKILLETTGLVGTNEGTLEGALSRIETHIHYNAVNDIYEIGAWYAVAIAKAHAFNDGNKRTGLTTMLTYLELQGVTVPSNIELDDIMVEAVEAKDEHDVIVSVLASFIRTTVALDARRQAIFTRIKKDAIADVLGLELNSEQ